MKTFIAMLAALLAAGVIFASAWAVVAKVHTWENRKGEALRILSVLHEQFEEISQDSRGGSLETLTSALRMMNKNENERQQMLAALKEILENKPFFLPLNREESKNLADVKSALAARKASAAAAAAATPEAIVASSTSIVRASPTPTPFPSVTPPVRITLTNDVSVQSTYGTMVLHRGTVVQFISSDGGNVRFRYLDADYEVPVSATDYQ